LRRTVNGSGVLGIPGRRGIRVTAWPGALGAVAGTGPGVRIAPACPKWQVRISRSHRIVRRDAREFIQGAVGRVVVEKDVCSRS